MPIRVNRKRSIETMNKSGWQQARKAGGVNARSRARSEAHIRAQTCARPACRSKIGKISSDIVPAARTTHLSPASVAESD
jgi:hypothetical protein